MATNNGRTDEIDVQQIERNRRLIEDSTRDSPQNEEILAGDANYGERLYGQLPEDRVGFMPGNKKR